MSNDLAVSIKGGERFLEYYQELYREYENKAREAKDKYEFYEKVELPYLKSQIDKLTQTGSKQPVTVDTMAHAKSETTFNEGKATTKPKPVVECPPSGSKV